MMAANDNSPNDNSPNDNSPNEPKVVNLFTKAPLQEHEIASRADSNPWSTNALTLCLSQAVPEILARDATKGLLIIKNTNGDTSVAFPAGMTPLEILLLLTEASRNIEASILNRVVLPKLEVGRNLDPNYMFAMDDEDLEFSFVDEIAEDDDDDPA